LIIKSKAWKDLGGLEMRRRAMLKREREERILEL
jgi:hypothetical protein